MISEESRELVKEKFSKTLEGVLKDNPELALIKEVRTAKNWFGKSSKKKEPEKITGMIIKMIIDAFSDNFTDEFLNSIGESINKNSDLPSGRTIAGFVPGLEAYIPLEFLVNELPVANLDLGLYQNTGFVLHDVQKLSDPTKMSFHIKTVEVTANLHFFTKMIIGKKKKRIADYKFELNEMNISIP